MMIFYYYIIIINIIIIVNEKLVLSFYSNVEICDTEHDTNNK